MQLRSTIQQIRNNCESFQYELYRVAQSKGYYKPAEQATPQEIAQVKTELEQQILQGAPFGRPLIKYCNKKIYINKNINKIY